MSVLLESYFDLEGTKYDIIRNHSVNGCSVVRNDDVLFFGCLSDCRKFVKSYIYAFNCLY